MKRAILPILVIALLLTVPAIPAMKPEKTSSGEEEVMSIIIGKDNEGFDIAKISADKSGVDTFVNDLREFKTWMETNRPFKDFELTLEEINAIKTQINGLLVSLNSILVANDLDPITADWLYDEMFETQPGRSTIISVGFGLAFIPFYDYETFFGIQLRPIWLLYPSVILGGGGYTGNINVRILPPRIEYGDRVGGHLVRTTIFSGLYVDVGDLGYDKMLGGLMIMLGRARVVM